MHNTPKGVSRTTLNSMKCMKLPVVKVICNGCRCNGQCDQGEMPILGSFSSVLEGLYFNKGILQTERNFKPKIALDSLEGWGCSRTR